MLVSVQYDEYNPALQCTQQKSQPWYMIEKDTNSFAHLLALQKCNKWQSKRKYTTTKINE